MDMGCYFLHPLCSGVCPADPAYEQDRKQQSYYAQANRKIRNIFCQTLRLPSEKMNKTAESIIVIFVKNVNAFRLKQKAQNRITIQSTYNQNTKTIYRKEDTELFSVPSFFLFLSQSSAISLSTSSSDVAQLVAIRMTQRSPSIFSQKPSSTFSESSAAFSLSNRTNI